MGVDASLFLSNRFQVSDIAQIISKRFETTTKIIQTSETQYNYCQIHFEIGEERRQLSVHTNYNRGGFTGTLLSFGAWGLADKILTAVANVTGGFFEPRDDTGEIQAYDSKATGNIEFILKQAMIDGDCDGKNIQEFIECLKSYL